MCVCVCVCVCVCGRGEGGMEWDGDYTRRIAMRGLNENYNSPLSVSTFPRLRRF
jgi:hypothetical protein